MIDKLLTSHKELCSLKFVIILQRVSHVEEVPHINIQRPQYYETYQMAHVMSYSGIVRALREVVLQKHRTEPNKRAYKI